MDNAHRRDPAHRFSQTLMNALEKTVAGTDIWQGVLSTGGYGIQGLLPGSGRGAHRHPR